MYPTDMPWTDPDYSGIQVDPLAVVRMIWASPAVQARREPRRHHRRDDQPGPHRQTGGPEADGGEGGADGGRHRGALGEGRLHAGGDREEQRRDERYLAAAGRPATGVVLITATAPGGTKRSVKNLWIDSDAGSKAYVWSGKAWVASTAAAATISARLADYNAAIAGTAKALTAWKAVKEQVSAAKQKQSDVDGGEAEPFTLTWWDTQDLGDVIDEPGEGHPV